MIFTFLFGTLKGFELVREEELVELYPGRKIRSKNKEKEKILTTPIGTTINESAALRSLLDEVKRQRQADEATLAEIRRARIAPDWSRIDALNLSIGQRQIQENLLNEHIAESERIRNRARLMQFTDPILFEKIPPTNFVRDYLFPYESRGIVQNVQTFPDRDHNLILGIIGAAILLGLALLASVWWWKYNPPTPALVSQIPSQVVAQAQCQTGSGTFRIGDRVLAATHVGPCSSGFTVPQGSAVYADSDLKLFGVAIAKTGVSSNPNDRFIGYTRDAVALQTDSGFYYVPGVSQSVADDWKTLLTNLGHTVDGVRSLEQR